MIFLSIFKKSVDHAKVTI